MTQFKAEAEAAFKESKKHSNKLAKFLELVIKQGKDEIELGEFEAHSTIADEFDVGDARESCSDAIGCTQAAKAQKMGSLPSPLAQCSMDRFGRGPSLVIDHFPSKGGGG